MGGTRRVCEGCKGGVSERAVAQISPYTRNILAVLIPPIQKCAISMQIDLEQS
jgi:hypothetical protein